MSSSALTHNFDEAYGFFVLAEKHTNPEEDQRASISQRLWARISQTQRGIAPSINK
jgi:hypothetical protein